MMKTKSRITGTINLGNPDEVTIKELAKKIIGLTNLKSKIIFKDLLEDDPKKCKPNIIRAKQILHWNTKVELDDGLKITINY